jgi:hypothetical protein
MFVTRELVDNGSQAKILFLLAFDQMGYDQRQLKKQQRLYTVSEEKELNQWGQ